MDATIYVKTLNLYSKEQSEVNYTIHTFPDGEVHLEILDSLKGIDILKIIAPIRNSNELFITIQALELTSHLVREITVPYLMSARNDRKMTPGRANSLRLVLLMLKITLTNKDHVRFITPHNEKLINNILLSQVHSIEIVRPFPEEFLSDDTLIVFPDEGSERRFGLRHEHQTSFTAEKVRDLNSGKILTYDFDLAATDVNTYKQLVVVDDLVDGGATFKILAESLKDVKIKKILVVTHYVQYLKLIDLTSYFDLIYVTNTYGPAPTNEKIIEITWK